MAEYIERDQAVRKAIDACIKVVGHGISQVNAVDIADEIDSIPAADVVEVVRCKECKHWLKDVAGCSDFVGRCEWANYFIGANGYCVFGEKIDEKGEGE